MKVATPSAARTRVRPPMALMGHPVRFLSRSGQAPSQQMRAAQPVTRQQRAGQVMTRQQRAGQVRTQQLRG